MRRKESFSGCINKQDLTELYFQSDCVVTGTEQLLGSAHATSWTDRLSQWIPRMSFCEQGSLHCSTQWAKRVWHAWQNAKGWSYFLFLGIKWNISSLATLWEIQYCRLGDGKSIWPAKVLCQLSIKVIFQNTQRNKMRHQYADRGSHGKITIKQDARVCPVHTHPA